MTDLSPEGTVRTYFQALNARDILLDTVTE